MYGGGEHPTCRGAPVRTTGGSMNVRDAIAEAGQRWIEEEGTLRALPDYVIAALCPPGSRVVVDRSTKPCETCGGTGMGSRWIDRSCRACDGSGVVEATTIHGLEQAGDRTLDRLREMFGIEATDLDAVCAGIEAYDRRNLRIIYEQDAELRRLRAAMQSTINAAVALPEETPQ